ncbi:hypothetical protein ACLOJK_014603 [Asimina triloba]
MACEADYDGRATVKALACVDGMRVGGEILARYEIISGVMMESCIPTLGVVRSNRAITWLSERWVYAKPPDNSVRRFIQDFP